MYPHLNAASVAGLIGTAAVLAVPEISAMFSEANLPVSEKFAEYGISGLLVSVIVYITYLLLNKTLQSRETDLAWHRSELAKNTEVFKEVLDKHEKMSADKQTYIVDKITGEMDKLEGRITFNSDNVAKVIEAMRNVTAALDDMKDVIRLCECSQCVKHNKCNKE